MTKTPAVETTNGGGGINRHARVAPRVIPAYSLIARLKHPAAQSSINNLCFRAIALSINAKRHNNG